MSKPGELMTVAVFVKSVSEMRDAQRRYFATRNPETLRDAKRLESVVDAWLRRRQLERAQPPLFETDQDPADVTCYDG